MKLRIAVQPDGSAWVLAPPARGAQRWSSYRVGRAVEESEACRESRGASEDDECDCTACQVARAVREAAKGDER